MREFDPSQSAAETVTAIQQLHRHDSHVGFVRPFAGGAEDWRLEGAFTRFTMSDIASYIDDRYGQGTLFDSDQEGVRYDSYMTVNPIRPARPLTWQPDRSGETIRTPIEAHTHFRAEDRLITHITAVWVDVDCDEIGLSPRDALYALDAVVDSGAIPEPSSYVRSGGGVWFKWYLSDQEGNVPRATEDQTTEDGRVIPGTKTIARNLNRRLVWAFAPLNADPAAVNLNRFLRVPNSVHTDAKKRVSWWVRQVVSGGPATYSLDQLDRLFQGPKFESVPEQIERYLREQGKPTAPRTDARKGLPAHLTAKPKRRSSKPRPNGQPIDRKKQAAGVKGQKKVHHVRRSVIEFKARVWGGVPEGRRNAVMLYYAAALYHSGAVREETALFRAVQKLPLQNPDTIKRGEVRKVIRSAMKSDPYRPVRYVILAELLDLTTEESDAFFTETHETFPAAGETKDQAETRHSQLRGPTRRRATLRTFLTQLDSDSKERPPHKEIRRRFVEYLREVGELKADEEVSRSTYLRDMKAIGETTPIDEGTPTSLEL